MKHRLGIILLMLLILLLSGCACEHEWSDADCLNPQICAKCGEVGQAALGHDWIDATCAEPETCIHCGATQGEALGHSYGDWAFGEEDMTHTCSVCAFAETTEIDRELYLDTMLPGYWDLWSMDYDGTFLNGADYLFGSIRNDHEDRSAYLHFGENRSCQITMKLSGGRYNGAGTWELIDYIDSGDETVYKIYVHTTKPSVQTLVIELQVDPDGMNLITFTGSNFTMWFYQEQEDILEGICKNWVIDETFVDHSYCFQFRPDRTVTCYVEGVFEGTWTLGGFTDDGDAVGFSISHVRNGQEEAFVGYIQLRGPDISAPTLYLVSGFNSVLGEYTFYEFQEASDEELTIVQNATNMLAGTWTSIGFGSSNPEFADSVTTDYSITIAENNKVTLNLADGRTYTGSWSAKAVSENLYQYYLYFTELNKTLACKLEARGDYPWLGIDEVGSDANMLYFKQMSEQEIAGPTLPIGTWTSDHIYHQGTRQVTDTSEYSITFHEDGTFTGKLGQEVRGTWRFLYYNESTIYGSDGGETLLDRWTYLLSLEGESKKVHIEKYRNNPGLDLQITITDSEGNKITYYFNKD